MRKKIKPEEKVVENGRGVALDHMLNAIEIMHEAKVQFETYAKEDVYTFVRLVDVKAKDYGTFTQHKSTWKVLLDRVKTKIAVRDGSGLKIEPLANKTMHTVIAPKGTRALLLGGKADKTMANAILNGLADQKYGSGPGSDLE